MVKGRQGDRAGVSPKILSSGLVENEDRIKNSIGPGVGDGSLITFLGGQNIEMKGGEILKNRVRLSEVSVIDGLNVLVAFVAEVDPIRFFSLCKKIMKRFLILIITERAEQSIDSPLIAAIGTEEIALPCFLFQQT